MKNVLLLIIGEEVLLIICFLVTRPRNKQESENL